MNRHKPTSDGVSNLTGCDPIGSDVAGNGAGESDDDIMANAQHDPAAFGEIFERH